MGLLQLIQAEKWVIGQMSGPFTVNDFIGKWGAVELKERSATQEHFLDLCRLLGEPSPAQADPTGDFYCFEPTFPRFRAVGRQKRPFEAFRQR